MSIQTTLFVFERAIASIFLFILTSLYEKVLYAGAWCCSVMLIRKVTPPPTGLACIVKCFQSFLQIRVHKGRIIKVVIMQTFLKCKDRAILLLAKLVSCKRGHRHRKFAINFTFVWQRQLICH